MPMNPQMMMQLMQMMGGGVQGPQPIGNNSPQIPVPNNAQHNNVMMPPQQQQQQKPGQPGGALGGLVNTGENIQKLYGMGQGLFGTGGQAPVGGANPMSAGAQVANTSAGNAYLQANPQLMAGGQGAFGAQGQATPFMQPPFGAGGSQGGMFGSQGAGGGMYGMQGPPQMFGQMGAGGQGAEGATGAGGMFGAGGASGSATAGSGSTADAVGAGSSSSMPEWLQSILDAL